MRVKNFLVLCATPSLLPFWGPPGGPKNGTVEDTICDVICLLLLKTARLAPAEKKGLARFGLKPPRVTNETSRTGTLLLHVGFVVNARPKRP